MIPAPNPDSPWVPPAHGGPAPPAESPWGSHFPEEREEFRAEHAGDHLRRLASEVSACTRCPRLVMWREGAASDPPARFRNEPYWARPLPGIGDSRARLLVLGLAPAAHGGNRTGRIFTGDRSGDWLFRALHKAGFANQRISEHPGDGLELTDCYVSAVVRCAPPANKPAPSERDNCLPYLVREIALLRHLKVVVALGAFAWDGALRALHSTGTQFPSPRPRFGHGVILAAGGYTLLGSYHPSQQNTFTGRLTEPAFDSVFQAARETIGRRRRAQPARPDVKTPGKAS